MELTPLTLGIILVVLVTAFMLVRGVLRIFVGTVVLAVSIWIGFRAWQLAPMFSDELFGQQVTWLPKAAAAIGFLLTYLLGRAITRVILGPFTGNTEHSGPLNLKRLFTVGLVALVPTGLLGSLFAVVLNHLHLIENLGQTTKSTSEEHSPSFATRFTEAIAPYIPEKWVHFLDPFADPQRVALAREIAAKAPLPPSIDPATGQPYPRAIIVDDPELNALAKDRDYTDLLHSPRLTKALSDPRVLDLLKRFQQ